MGRFDKLERRLERGVNGAFAKAFRSKVQPVEIASQIRRAMDDRAASTGKGKRLTVPNLFTIELSPTDFDALTEHEADLADELIASAAEHAESQRYSPGGPISVHFVEDDSLETGVFALRPSTARQVQPTYDAAPAARPAPAQHMPPAGATQQAPTYAAPAAPYPAQPPAPTASVPAVGHAPAGAPATRRDDYRPSPAAPRKLKQRPWLDIDGERYPLLGAITVIGRDDDTDVMLDDPGISRRHSEIRVTLDGPHQIISIRDLGSTNGTFVNGDPISSTHLHDGDRITVGRTRMIVHEGGSR